MSIKQLRFPVSETVTCCRSSEDGKKGRPKETSSMKKVGLEQALEEKWTLVR